MALSGLLACQLYVHRRAHPTVDNQETGTYSVRGNLSTWAWPPLPDMRYRALAASLRRAHHCSARDKVSHAQRSDHERKLASRVFLFMLHVVFSFKSTEYLFGFPFGSDSFRSPCLKTCSFTNPDRPNALIITLSTAWSKSTKRSCLGPITIPLPQGNAFLETTYCLSRTPVPRVPKTECATPLRPATVLIPPTQTTDYCLPCWPAC